MMEEGMAAFVRENMMGPNALRILEELLRDTPLRPGMRVLDLGCGRGLTSVFLAKAYGVQVFALDLWVSATDNYRRFRRMGVADAVIPLQGDARDMPFAQGYFDAVVSVDAYHYAGCEENFFREKIRPVLREGALVALAVPGMKREMTGNVPAQMAPFWPREALATWHARPWWRERLAQELDALKLWEMDCFEPAWRDWLATSNPHAVADRAMMAADGGRFMNLVAATGFVRACGDAAPGE